MRSSAVIAGVISIAAMYALILLQWSSTTDGYSMDGAWDCHRRGAQPTSFKFYIHSVTMPGAKENNENVVAAVNGNLTQRQFGSIIVLDALLTDSSSLHDSKHLGRAQGMYAYDNSTGLSVYFAFSAIIETEEHQGVIEFAGANRLQLPKRNMSVIGGSGDFSQAHGVATIQSISVTRDKYILFFDVHLSYCSSCIN